MRFAKRFAVSVLSMGVAWLLVTGSSHADQASTYYHKAMAYKKDGDISNAIKSLHQAIEQREDYAAAHYSLGILYRQSKNNERAIFHLERAAQLDGKNAQILYSLGLAYQQANRQKDAIETLTKAADAKPTDDQVQSALGTMLLREDVKKAILHLEAAVKVKPNDPYYLQQLGLAYRMANNNPQAEKHLTRSAALKKDPITEFNLGVLYRRMQQQEKAVSHYEEALRLDEKMTAAYWDLANLYSQMKQYNEAIEAFNKYLELAKDSKDAPIAKKRIQELRGKKK
jgi:tetratricopeptide (TPR) repeat protein